MRSRDPRRAAAMFLEASVAHMMTGDLDALIASAERARALSAGAEPAVELLATAVIGEGQIALGEVAAGAALLRACEPYLMEADPLAIVEIVGMAGHASIWLEDWDARVARADARARCGARRERRVRADPPARRPGPPRSAPRPLGARAGRRVGVRRARRGHRPARAPPPLAGRADAGRGEPRARGATAAATSRAGSSWRGGDGDGAYLHAALGLLELGLGPDPRGDRGAGDRPPPDAATRPELDASCSCGPT